MGCRAGVGRGAAWCLAAGALDFGLWRLTAATYRRSAAAGSVLHTLAAFVMIVLGLFLALAAANLLYEVPRLLWQGRLARVGVAAEAVVTRSLLAQGPTHGTLQHILEYAFPSPEGAQNFGRLSRGFDTGLREGDRFTVLYRPAEPDRHLIWAESAVEVTGG